MWVIHTLFVVVLNDCHFPISFCPAPLYLSCCNRCVRRVTRSEIPDAVGKNEEGNSWIIALTWSRKTKGTTACAKSVGALKMFRGMQCKIRTIWSRLIV